MPHLKRLISTRTVHNLLYLPKAVSRIQTWVPFFLDYAGIGSTNRTYELRNGIQIATHEYMDTATIGVIFLRKDYGDIEDNSVVIDVGANIGVFALYAASTARNTVVYAYEPMPANFAVFEENVRRNGLGDRIKPFPYGLAGEREKRQLYLADINVGHSLYQNGAGGQCVTINCLRLQDVFEENRIEKCHLLKMDCEGAEFECLYNTPDEYFERIEKIRLEYHCDLTETTMNHTVADLAGFLESKNFRITKLLPEILGRGMLWAEK